MEHGRAKCIFSLCTGPHAFCRWPSHLLYFLWERQEVRVIAGCRRTRIRRWLCVRSSPARQGVPGRDKGHTFFSHSPVSQLYANASQMALSGEEPACRCARCKRRGFDPWVGKIPWRRAWHPTPVSLPGESHGQRSLAGHSPWGRRESDTPGATWHPHVQTRVLCS